MSRSTDFADLTSRVYGLYEVRRYAEALDLLDPEEENFPDHPATVTFWRACLLAVSVRPDDALALLKDGLDRGLWWSDFALRQDPDLDTVRALSGFERVADESHRRAVRAIQELAPPVVLQTSKAPPRALLVALHGGAGRADSFAPHWELATDAGVVVAVPQSPVPANSDADGFMWREPGFEEDLASVLVGIRKDDGRRTLPLVLGGFSQGGRLAVRVALTGRPVTPVGVITVGAGVGLELEALLEAARRPGDRAVRFWFLTGDKDFVRPDIETLHRTLLDAGFTSSLTVLPGLGHEVPSNFGKQLAPALAFVLEGTGGDPPS
jgi:predicted esterase